MKMTARLLLLLTCSITSLWGQSAADLAERFPRHDVYEVEPGIVMTAKFTHDGSVCEMRVEQSHFKGEVTDFIPGIELSKMDGLLDRLVPAADRGAKLEDLSGLMIATGVVMQQVDDYENVTVNKTWSTAKQNGSAVLHVKWKNRICG